MFRLQKRLKRFENLPGGQTFFTWPRAVEKFQRASLMWESPWDAIFVKLFSVFNECVGLSFLRVWRNRVLEIYNKTKNKLPTRTVLLKCLGKSLTNYSDTGFLSLFTFLSFFPNCKYSIFDNRHSAFSPTTVFWKKMPFHHWSFFLINLSFNTCKN